MAGQQGSSRPEFIARIGTFFIWVGIILLIFFFLSDSAGQAVFSYFCWSSILLILGFIFRSQLKKTYQPSGRFSILKKLKRKPKEDKGKK
jgi:hypothetical protein